MGDFGAETPPKHEKLIDKSAVHESGKKIIIGSEEYYSKLFDIDLDNEDDEDGIEEDILKSLKDLGDGSETDLFKDLDLDDGNEIDLFKELLEKVGKRIPSTSDTEDPATTEAKKPRTENTKNSEEVNEGRSEEIRDILNSTADKLNVGTDDNMEYTVEQSDSEMQYDRNSNNLQETVLENRELYYLCERMSSRYNQVKPIHGAK